MAVLTWGCRGTLPVGETPPPDTGKGQLQPMGYSIQAGAFTHVDNAIRLTAALQEKGLDAYYFLHDSGFFKVRFGNFATFALAVETAEKLRLGGTVDSYYIVKPEDYPAVRGKKSKAYNIREEIIATAKSFIGVPYQWGGGSEETGFDCSGLTMAVYQLNGFNLPRTSREQWLSGIPISAGHLSAGDLVFFSTKKNGKVSHVGIYIGGGRFIHAPRTGKKVQVATFSSTYFQNHYMGARRFIL